MNPVQIVYNTRPRLSDAVGNLADTLRQQQQQQDQQDQLAEQQAHQQAQAIVQYLTQKGASSDQWRATRNMLPPEVQKYMPDVATDPNEQAQGQLMRNAIAAVSNGTATQFQKMLVANQKAIGTEGGLKNEMYDRLNVPQPPVVGSKPGDLVGRQGGDLASILSGAGGQAPPDPQGDAARVAFGLQPNAYQSGQLTEKNRYDTGLLEQGDRRTTAYEGSSAASAEASRARAGASNASADTSRARTGLIQQEGDPNSGYWQGRRSVVTAKPTKAGDPVATAQKYASDLDKQADNLTAQASKQRDKNIAKSMMDQAGQFRARANQVRARIPQQPTGPQHFVMDSNGNMTSISGQPPAPPDDESDDENDE